MGFAAFSVILAAVTLEVLGQVAFKVGARRAHAGGDAGVLRYWASMLADRWVLAGLALHVAELACWIAALVLLPLSVAFPLMALSYAGVAIAGHFWLGERLGTSSRLAVALITAGAALVALP